MDATGTTGCAPSPWAEDRLQQSTMRAWPSSKSESVCDEADKLRSPAADHLANDRG